MSIQTDDLLKGEKARAAVNEALSNSMGPEFENIVTLPWPKPKVPVYIEVTTHKWMLRRMPDDIPFIRGYFNGLQKADQSSYVLSPHKNNVPGPQRAAVTPTETEALMPHLAACANGHVVVAGLNLGLMLYNLALNRDVERITVYERDQAMINLFRKIMVSSALLGKRVEIVKADILHGVRKPHVNADHVFIDIWKQMGKVRARSDVMRIMRQFPKATGSWHAMELDFVEWCATALREDEGPQQIGRAHV